MLLSKIFENFSKLRYNSEYNNLHRWCHPMMESYKGCTHDKILKKIDFANYDNSACLNHKPKNNIDSKGINTPQLHINYMSN